MKITVHGCGYVGLVTGACLAEVGNDVVGVDVDEARVEALNRGETPIYEPGLEALLHANRAHGRLRFTTNTAEAVRHGQLQFVAVGTPPREDGAADLQYVLAVARAIGEHMEEFTVIVDKSTVPVGTADQVSEAVAGALAARGAAMEFSVASNPEFLKEGDAVSDFMKPDRVVIGTDDERAAALLRELYAPFNRNHERVLEMDVRSAELTKYAANAMLAARISFMNELANIAERVGADIEQVRVGIGSDSRIGYSFIYPGCGYGGSCFPKDVRALEQTAHAHSYQPQLLRAIDAVNEEQKHVLGHKLGECFQAGLEGRTIAVWGLAFKPNTDDLREASSGVLIAELLAAGATVRAYDPQAMNAARALYADIDGVTFCDEALDAAEGADALAVVTEWKEFRSPDFKALKGSLKQPIIVDGRNLYDPATLARAGFTYHAIGRPAVQQ